MKSDLVTASVIFATLLQSSVLAQTRLSALSVPWSEPLERATKLINQGEYREAVKGYDALLVAGPAAWNPEYRALILSQTANAEIELGDYLEAERRAREALSGLVSSQKAHSAAFAIAESALADALRAQADYGEAEARVRHALTLATETVGPTHPACGIILTSLVGLLIETRDLRHADAACRRMISIFEKAGQEYQVHGLGAGYQDLAVIQALRRRPKASLEAVRRALAIWNAHLPPDHPFVIDALSTEIAVYHDLKRFREAEEIIPEVLQRCLARFGPYHPVRVHVLSNAASVYFAEGKHEEAERLLQDSLAAARRCFRPGHPILVEALRNYAAVLRRLHRTEEASRFLAESNLISASALRKTGR